MKLESDSPASPRPVTAEAERWLARHDRGLSAAETEAFVRWRAESPTHAAEFDRLSATWQNADLLQTNSDLRALTTHLEAAALLDLAARRGRRARLLWSTGLAAAAVVAFALLQPWRAPDAGAPAVGVATATSVDVRPAEARRLVLPDGSVVQLRGNSEVRPEFTATERRVRLVRGEAHFAVKKDPARPFLVEAQGAAVRAVGTAFNVQLSPTAIDVLVTEGVIALHDAASPGAVPIVGDAPRAQAGHRARVSISGGRAAAGSVTVSPVSPAEIEQSLSWQFAAIIFRRATLAEAIAAFNAQAGTRFELADPKLHSRQISGTFTVNQAAAFVRLLEQAAEVRVERARDGRVRLHAATP